MIRILLHLVNIQLNKNELSKKTHALVEHKVT